MARKAAARDESGGGLFGPEWYAQSLAAAVARSPVAGLPARIQTMHRQHGTTAGQKCKGCKFFETYQQASRWHKCGLTVQTSGAGTDWRAGWPACGKFEAGQGAERRID